ncbi:MAG: hypothetical protein ACOC1F_03975, partial [Myxococcota bacterium]
MSSRACTRSMTDPSAGSFVRIDPIEHDLAPDYPVLRRIRSRTDLLQHRDYPRWARVLQRVLPAVEQGVHANPQAPSDRRLRVGAWNIQRGTKFEALREALATVDVLRESDVLMLAEVDNGMARSGHRNVARALAEALRLHYAFGVSYLV